MGRAALAARPGPRTVRAARSILLLSCSELVGKGSTLIIVVGAARVLPLADFGVFSVALGAGALAAVVPSWGFDTSLVRQGTSRPEVLPALLAQLLVLRWGVVAAAVTGFATAGVAAGTHRTALLAVGCVVIACLCDTVTEALRSVAIAREQQHLVGWVQLVQRGATAVLATAVLLAWRDRALLPLSAAYLAGSAVGTAAMAVPVARLGVRPAWAAVRWRALVRLCTESWPAGVHSITSMGLFRVDAVLLAVLAGTEAAGRRGPCACEEMHSALLGAGWLRCPVRAGKHFGATQVMGVRGAQRVAADFLLCGCDCRQGLAAGAPEARSSTVPLETVR